MDGSGNAYLTGQTNSTDYPQVNPIPRACLGTCGTGSFPQDAFVTEVNAAGSALLYSSYLAGNTFTEGFVIAADSLGNAYAVGLTQSADFPRVNQIAAACIGTCGNRNSSALFSSTIGGSSTDQGHGIAVDASGNAYLTGSTGSADFPVVSQIPGACLGNCGAASNQDAFVVKIGP